MHKRFHLALRCVCTALLLAACASPKPPAAQLDPAYKGAGFRKYFVVGLSAGNLTDHREFENLMVAQLQDAGVMAVPGWKYLPANKPPNEATIRAAIAKSGADAVLLTRISDFTRKKDDVIAAVPVNGYAPEDYGDKYGYAKQDMHADWYVVGPALVEYQRATVYSTLFDVHSQSPVWSFNVPGFNPATLQQDVAAYMTQLVNNLRTAKLLRP